MKMKNINSIKQTGIALVLSLVILLAMTLVGVATMSGASLQERMVANQKRSSEAAMSAQAALEMHFDWLASDPKARWTSETWDKNNHTYGFKDGKVTRYRVTGWNEKGSWHIDGDPDTPCEEGDTNCIPRKCNKDATECVATAIGEVVIDEDGSEKIFASANLDSEFKLSERLSPFQGDADILCETAFSSSKIDLRNTILHCNGNVDVDAKGNNNELANSTITSSGTASVTVKENSKDDNSSVQSDADRITLVSIKEFIKNIQITGSGSSMTLPAIEINQAGELSFVEGASLKLDLANSENSNIGAEAVDCDGGSVPTCELDFSGTDDNEGKVHFCNGHADIKNGNEAARNSTIISVCDMTHNGALGVQNDVVNNTFFAGGDMIFNGTSGKQSEFSGGFFGGGDVQFNGGVDVTGQMLVNETIDVDGDFTFTGDQVDSDSVPKDIEQLLVVSSWRQSWE